MNLFCAFQAFFYFIDIVSRFSLYLLEKSIHTPSIRCFL